MRCNNCGAEIMDGSPNCPNCGAPVMTVNQNFAPVGGGKFSNPVFEMITKFGSIPAAVLIFLGAIISSWYVLKISFMGISESTGFGLFESGGGSLKVWGILLIIVAVGAVLIDFVPAVSEIVKGLPYYQFYLPALGLIAFILGSIDKHVKDVRDAAKEYGSMASSHFGIAWWFVLLGLIILIAKGVIGMMNENK